MLTEQQQKWLKRTAELFMRYGIKSITMDDVSRELGISKKTLYQFVENKNDLVMKVMELHIQEEKEECFEQSEKSADAIDEMFLVMEANTQQMQQMKSNIVYDLQKYHHEVWEKLQEFIQGFLFPQHTYKKELLFKEYLMHYLYGIVSEKGLQVLKAKLS